MLEGLVRSAQPDPPCATQCVSPSDRRGQPNQAGAVRRAAISRAADRRQVNLHPDAVQLVRIRPAERQPRPMAPICRWPDACLLIRLISFFLSLAGSGWRLQPEIKPYRLRQTARKGIGLSYLSSGGVRASG